MAKRNIDCECGRTVTVLSGIDSNSGFRSDGKQLVYPERKPYNYNVFRCDVCLSVIKLDRGK